MGSSNYSDEFKRDAVARITVRGYPVRELSRRLGVSTHSLYKWVKLFGGPAPEPGTDLGDFIAAYNYARRLKTLRGLTPYETVVKCRTEEPDRFKLDPRHHMPGPKS